MALGGVYALARDMELLHLAGFAGSGLLLVAIGSVARLGRIARGSAVSLALMVAASLVVHAAGGAAEAHFLFFLAVPVVALYGSWVPLGAAVGFVLCHHLVIGALGGMDALGPGSTPVWERAAIHGGLLLAACAVALLEWHMSESRLVRLREEIVDRSAEASGVRDDGLAGRERIGLRRERAVDRL
jgi:hypothetical protein